MVNRWLKTIPWLADSSALVSRFQPLLPAGDKIPSRIIDQIKLQFRTVTEGIEPFQNLDALLIHTAAPLTVNILFQIAGERTDNDQIMAAAKLRQPFPSLLGHDRQIAAQHPAGRQPLSHALSNERKSGFISGQPPVISRVRSGGDGKKPGDLIHDFNTHYLGTTTGSVYVAVAAVQIAQVAQIDLQGLQAFKGFKLRIYRLQTLLKRCRHNQFSTPFLLLNLIVQHRHEGKQPEQRKRTENPRRSDAGE